MEEINPLYKQIALELKLGELKSYELIQNLWSGYGEIVRLSFENKSIIIKHVKLPKTFTHPKGWNSEFSHKRKIKSYEVEVTWYEKFCSSIDTRCTTAKGLKSYKTNDEWLIIMEDLRNSGFSKIVKDAKEVHLKASLTWLANFHAKYLNTKSEDIWEEGTYWHLDTRPHELEVLDDVELKAYAKRIDRELNNCKYQTIIHGDAKLANFCFNEQGTVCVAVDFQYVGHGCGMKDVVLFISSTLEAKECERLESWFLQYYFNALKASILEYKKDIDFNELEKEYKKMYFLAWADFLRFLKGWSPGHFKINSYSENMKDRAIKYLKSKESDDV